MSLYAVSSSLQNPHIESTTKAKPNKQHKHAIVPDVLVKYQVSASCGRGA